nr:hypothetical protein [Tanacetum cinerariifolium]
MEAIGAHDGVTQASRDIVALYNEYMPTSHYGFADAGGESDTHPLMTCLAASDSQKGNGMGVPPPANNKGFIIKANVSERCSFSLGQSKFKSRRRQLGRESEESNGQTVVENKKPKLNPHEIRAMTWYEAERTKHMRCQNTSANENNKRPAQDL